MVWRVFLDFLYPSICLICRRDLGPRERIVCEACWERSRLEERRAFYVGRRGISRSFSDGSFYARSANRLNPGLAGILHQYKYKGFSSLSERLARPLASVVGGDEKVAGADLLLPVPLTRAKRAERGFNQSLLLARRLSFSTGIPVGEKMVVRRGGSRSQTLLGERERWRNVRGAFRLRRGASLRGRRVAVVDDVVTSGATSCTLAEELMRGGASGVVVLSVAHAGDWASSSS